MKEGSSGEHNELPQIRKIQRSKTDWKWKMVKLNWRVLVMFPEKEKEKFIVMEKLNVA